MAAGTELRFFFRLEDFFFRRLRESLLVLRRFLRRDEPLVPRRLPFIFRRLGVASPSSPPWRALCASIIVARRCAERRRIDETGGVCAFLLLRRCFCDPACFFTFVFFFDSVRSLLSSVVTRASVLNLRRPACGAAPESEAVVRE